MAQRNELINLLQKFEEFFNRKLGTWKTDTLDFGIKEDSKTILSQPYPVPKVHEEMFKN